MDRCNFMMNHAEQANPMTTESSEHTKTSFTAVIESVGDGQVVLSIAHTNYQLHLAAQANGHDFKPGAHVHGIVRGEALRMHPARGGGKFIEPIWGPPRIVAGVVLEADPTSRTVTVDAVARFHLKVSADQKFEILVPGALVNFYIKSGATFVPVE